MRQIFNEGLDIVYETNGCAAAMVLVFALTVVVLD